jgi:hypothetical protein
MEILSTSLPGRFIRGLPTAIKNSSLVNWYQGSEAFHELTGFRNSLTFKVLAYGGQGFGYLINSTGKLLRFLLEPAVTFRFITQLHHHLPRQPIRLISILGLSALLTNSSIMLIKNPHWSLRSIVLRGTLSLVLVGGLYIKLSWEQLTGSSMLVRLTRDFIWGD